MTGTGRPATCEYARSSAGPSSRTSSCLASASASPVSINFASHTKSVASTSGLRRPPACFSKAFRCRKIRSRSDRNESNAGRRATNASSRYRRRSAGPPFTSSRSSGANTEIRNAPRRSRVRANFCLLTCTLPRPVEAISASMRSCRPSRSPSARTIAEVAPDRTNASFGAPRNDDNVAR